MGPAPQRRAWFRVMGGVACGAGLALVVWLPFGVREREPQWLAALNETVPLVSEHPPSAIAPRHHAEQVRIINDVLRRRAWGINEADDLAAILRRGYPVPLNAGRRLTREEFGQAMVHMAASVALIARLESGAPMSPPARAAATDALLDELDAEFPERRQHAAVALVATGLVRDPFVRARVERLLDDPDAETAEIVALQLAHHDERHGRASVLASGAEPVDPP